MSALKMLIPEAEQVLQILAGLELLEDFTFVGGSALTVYLSHRYSEDIDLFTWQETLNSVDIQNKLAKAGFTDLKILNLSQSEASFLLDDVKVTFFANDWEPLKNRKKLENHLYIADLGIIAVMKVNTLFMRATFRDYYDLYVLNLHHFSLQELYEMTAIHMSNLTKSLFQRAILFIEDIEDENIAHLQPAYQVSLKAIQAYFTHRIKEWNGS
jgi:predicted nucleotidyltransferase component of viral defense system